MACKSMLLKNQREHAQTDERRSGRRMIVAAELPPVPLLRSLYAEIIRSMNADVSPTTRLHELEGTAINMLSHASPRMLLIDEIHNLLSCSARDQRAALNAIKYLAIKLRVSIVAAGTYEALHVMRSDLLIASRFEQHELPDGPNRRSFGGSSPDTLHFCHSRSLLWKSTSASSSTCWSCPTV
jgi:hypothetical protein